MVIKNIHEKLLNSVQQMLIDTRINLPFYGEYNLHINFHEQDTIGTCAVNVTSKGMNFFYSPKFLENMSQKEVNFIDLHEIFHLLFSHPRRTVTGQYDHKMSNIVQDMIINHIIWEDIPHAFVEIPKSPDGKNMALFVPKEYTGKLIFEELYEWMKEEKEKWQKEQKGDCSCKTCNGTGKKQDGKSQSNQQGQEKGDGQGQDKSEGQGQQPGEGKGEGQDKSEGQGQQPGEGKGEGQDKSEGQGQQPGEGQSNEKGKQPGGGQGGGQSQEPCPDCDGTGNESGKDSSGKPSYGPYGQNPRGKDDSLDTWSKEQIFQDMENNNGEYMDKHISDDVPEEMRNAMVKDVMERLAARGLAAGNLETTLNKLRKKRKDYLKEIKRAVSNMIFGTTKEATIVKPNRKGISGIKGNRKVKTKINVILDTSGSMGGQGTFERVLNYVFRHDIEINFIESDTEIKWVEKIKNAKKLQSLPIKGLGGTMMQTGIDYVVEHFNDCNSVLLTDGYHENLDLSKLKGKLLIISVGVKSPIGRSNGKVKQIVLEANDK
jgi:predicted metal-dependent peptidase